MLKDIYQYVVPNQLQSSVLAQRRVKLDALTYIIINELLFLTSKQEKWANITPHILFRITENLEPIILHKYHTGLFAACQGTWETFFTMRKNFFMYSRLVYIPVFVKECAICKWIKIKSLKNRPVHPQIPTDHSSMQNLLWMQNILLLWNLCQKDLTILNIC